MRHSKRRRPKLMLKPPPSSALGKRLKPMRRCWPQAMMRLSQRLRRLRLSQRLRRLRLSLLRASLLRLMMALITNQDRCKGKAYE